MNQFKTYFITGLSILSLCFSCKNEPKNQPATESVTPKSTSELTADITTIEVLDHDFKITPEGTKLFIKGFFGNKLIDGAISINSGDLHIKNGLITKSVLNLDAKTISMIANRDETVETFMRSDKAFDSAKYPSGSFTIEGCTKAVNDQQATHILTGKLELHGKSVPFSVRARVDYKSKYLTITSDQIVVKAPDLGIKMADPSQNNIYFSLTLNADLIL